MKHILLVFLGGGLGSVFRYAIGRYLNGTISTFPYGTFSVNIIGSLLIGILLGVTIKNTTMSQNVYLLLVVGFCGGFTTFSAFAYENYNFLKNGDLLNFSLYTLGSLILGFAAVFFGIWLARFF